MKATPTRSGVTYKELPPFFNSMPAPNYIPHYTIADYRQWEGDWELWRGIPVAMTPSRFGRHQKLATKISQRLLNAIEQSNCDDCEVVMELDWVISDDLVVRPDVAVCCGQDIDEFIRSAPKLIIEVLSDSTESKDRTAKYELYQDQAVEYYLMVDSRDKRVDAYCLSNGTYERSVVDLDNAATIQIKLHEHCKFDFDLSQL